MSAESPQVAELSDDTGEATMVIARRDDPSRLDDEIRTAVHELREGWEASRLRGERVVALLERAQEAGVAEAMGFPSWTAYMVDVFGDTLVELPTTERPVAAEIMSAQGMSTRAIGAVLGVSRMTVLRDLQLSQDVTVDNVIGLDGKTRRRPEPKPKARKEIEQIDIEDADDDDEIDDTPAAPVPFDEKAADFEIKVRAIAKAIFQITATRLEPLQTSREWRKRGAEYLPMLRRASRELAAAIKQLGEKTQ